MASKEVVGKMRERIGNVRATPLEGLIANPKWGEIDFSIATSELQTILDIAAHLQELPLQVLPDPVANSIFNSLETANLVFEAIRNFSVAQGTPSQNRDQLVRQIREASEQLLINTGSWIPFLAYQQGDVQKNISALSEAVGQANQALADASKDIQSKKDEIGNIINAAREASAGAGVAVFTASFAEQEIIFNAEANNWLIATGVAAATTLIAAFLSFFIPIKDTATNAQIFQFMTSKVILLVTLLTATVWCGRIYKASRHQASTCNHRANSLKTFQAFVKAASDDTTRNAVLLESTRSIFALAPSGYLDSTDAATDPGMKILEIVKASGKTGA